MNFVSGNKSSNNSIGTTKLVQKSITGKKLTRLKSSSFSPVSKKSRKKINDFNIGLNKNDDASGEDNDSKDEEKSGKSTFKEPEIQRIKQDLIEESIN